MTLTWLHVSDFHIKAGDPYDRDVVLNALVQSVARYRSEGRQADLVFATGDIAHGGKKAEYDQATPFFDALLHAAGLDRDRLFVIPGNHDVDRNEGRWLKRTVDTREEADDYFRGPGRLQHAQKMQAFIAWHDKYFDGIRRFPDGSTCAVPSDVSLNGMRLGILVLNSALFCQGEDDHAKLWLGRRCLDAAVDALAGLQAECTIALVHHPLDWLHESERSNIRTRLQDNFNLILSGHVHDPEIRVVSGSHGEALHIVAGATYQTRNWPNCAFYATYDGDGVELFPIHYSDTPREDWIPATNLFRDPPHTKRYKVPRRGGPPTPPPPSPTPPPPLPSRGNIPTRGNRPFEGRNDLLARMQAAMADTTREALVVLRGQPGVGKSELAQEYARRHAALYPGGAFLLEAGDRGIAVGLAEIGRRHCGLVPPPDRILDDQAYDTLRHLQAAATLLVFDNAAHEQAVAAWLPQAGVPCHVIVTTNHESWDPRWVDLPVLPLNDAAARAIVRAVAGEAAAEREGAALVRAAAGLPVQLLPAAAAARRGRLGDDPAAPLHTATASFRRAHAALPPAPQLLLRAAAQFNPLGVPKPPLLAALKEACGWAEADFHAAVGACLDLHLLQDGPALRMHQLFARFLRTAPVAPPADARVAPVLQALARGLVALAAALAANPNQPARAAELLAHAPEVAAWGDARFAITVSDGERIGRALVKIGAFATAQPWYERAVEAAEKGDAQGRVDHESLGSSLHHVGICLGHQGRDAEAMPWYERAVEAKQKSDVQGRVDHQSLGRSLHQVGICLSRQGSHAEAMPWYERAVAAKQKGDVQGRVDHESLARSLHEVGFCLGRLGRDAEAVPWYERAVVPKQKGDVHGHVDHDSLGRSLHEVGFCLGSQGSHAEALPWYERAVEAMQKGDVHGRVNHASLGSSLHQVGFCLGSLGRDPEAVPWYERAVEAKRKGDVHGRVDHESVGRSLHEVGFCLGREGSNAEALPWYERAVEAKQKGDVHGRVDAASLAISLRSGAEVLRRLGRTNDARDWDERAERAAG